MALVDRKKSSPRKSGAPSTAVWIVSCVLHAVLLWGLSTLSIASGVGGYGDASGLIIEGRFLGALGGDGSEDVNGASVTVSPEIHVVSAASTNANAPSTLDIDDSPKTDDTSESVDGAETTPSTRQTTPTRPDFTVIEDDTPPVQSRQRSRPARESVSGRSRKSQWRVLRPGDGGSAGRGHGDGTTFFDIGGRGTKFVYVIDRSDSMQEKRRLDAARNELLCSLHELAETSHVQVLFYNHDVTFIDAASRPTLLRNTRVQQRKFAQFAAGIQPDGATDHLRALALALKLTPDAIFLLTDAAEPKLHEADLDRLLRANRRRVPIHAVELGIGPLLESDNFLMRLARQNGGTYRYCNVEDLFENTLEIPAVTREDHESPATPRSRVR